jgi:hypothetical protein
MARGRGFVEALHVFEYFQYFYRARFISSSRSSQSGEQHISRLRNRLIKTETGVRQTIHYALRFMFAD